MRQLPKAAEPAVLSLNASAWTAEYQNALAAGLKPPTRWRHPDIVAALRVETCDKCAYCEGIIADVSYPHVEHMFPKSARPDLVVAWANLTLGCPVCNVEKADYYEPAAPLLNPYVEDPADHLEFAGPALFANLGDAAAERTIQKLKLMRPALVTERLKRLEALHHLLQRWHAEAGINKDFRAEVLRDALADDQEFSCCLRAHAAAHGFVL